MPTGEFVAKRGEPVPILSKAQQAAMYAAAAGKSTLGIPASVGKDFVAAGPAGGSFAKLPSKKKGTAQDAGGLQTR
jgi:hypothetical protein